MPKAKILVVEDDGIVAMDIQVRLGKSEYSVCGSASSGEQAINKAEKLNPDLVLMDIVLKGDMDGIKAAEIIQSKLSIPVVFVTAHADTERFERAKLVAPFGYIIKPFQDREFEIAIEMALYKAQKETEFKKLKSQIALSQKMESVGLLAAGIAHEINNPIGFVSSNIETLSNYMEKVDLLLKHYRKLWEILRELLQDNANDKIKEKVESIAQYEEEIEIDYLLEDIPELLTDCREGTQRVRRIVSDLKNFAHPGNDEPVSFDINKGLEATLNIVNNEIKYKATVVKDFGEIPLVHGYPQKLNQVFMNILVNAAQAIEKRGEIKIQTKKDGENVVISISDTGAGITEENLSKLFDPFFTTKAVGKGTGLGMNISYNIIKEHKGTIDVKSKVGQGTTFTILLPKEV